MLSYKDQDRGDTFYSDQPLVSVVIPAFNASTYIERTLRSVMRQTYAALEIVVVNDGSTDHTAKLVEQIAASDSRIRLLSTPNRGVAAARNTGIEASSGRFVAFLDADDLWHPTKIEKQVNALKRLSPRTGLRSTRCITSSTRTTRSFALAVRCCKRIYLCPASEC